MYKFFLTTEEGTPFSLKSAPVKIANKLFGNLFDKNFLTANDVETGSKV